MLRISFIILFIVVSYLLLSPSEKLPTVEVSDKTAHFIVFCCLMLNGGLAFGRKRYLVLGGLLLVYGGTVEILQPFVNRNASLFDAMANLSGVVAALIILLLFDKQLWKLLNFLRIKA